MIIPAGTVSILLKLSVFGISIIAGIFFFIGIFVSIKEKKFLLMYFPTLLMTMIVFAATFMVSFMISYATSFARIFTVSFVKSFSFVTKLFSGEDTSKMRKDILKDYDTSAIRAEIVHQPIFVTFMIIIVILSFIKIGIMLYTILMGRKKEIKNYLTKNVYNLYEEENLTYEEKNFIEK